eukprot:NODE_502_length_1411_cov_113.784875_g380_i0.p1 GENE.NODE_502_length_1411_cov_113.784875_g380_i0~~NODE_502_length_1411_cov_113.784875_g380_i0.p1  ORF type:complete len:388 (+),score=59.31 NODE_502_length_1411_cov_113.784875_g380_i0:85-1248(+)
MSQGQSALEIDRVPRADVCTICLEGLPGDPVRLPCAHKFCSPCISTWLAHSIGCPNCRAYFDQLGAFGTDQAPAHDGEAVSLIDQLTEAALDANVQFLNNVLEALAPLCTTLLNSMDTDGFTPLYCAAQLGDVTVLEIFLSNGANPNIPVANGCVPLHVAASKGRVSAVQVLLQHGADPNPRSAQGTTPLYAASAAGCPYVVEILLGLLHTPNGLSKTSNAPSDDDASSSSAETRKASSSSVETQKADPDCQNDDGNSPVHVAAFLGHCEVLHRLLVAGAMAHLPNAEGLTPLMLAILRKHTCCVMMLLKQPSVDVNAADCCGNTPLHIAVQQHYDVAVSALVAHGADPSRKSKNGRTPLMVALRAGYEDLAQTLMPKCFPWSLEVD